ncbi:MAG: septum formation initiator family protein [Anaerolineae bacterium]|nr:septum formation initiator family protein [Anaerolineae bacterium]
MSQTRREWLKHALHQAPWRTQVQATALVALGLVVSIIIGALYLAQATSTATAGRDLKVLERELDRLEQENNRLRAEVASSQTVPYLTQRARDLGFVQAGNDQVMYLVVNGYRPPEPEPVVPVAAEPLPEYDETLNDWLSEQWNGFLEQLNLRTGGD